MVEDRFTGAVTVQARPLLVLELEQVEQIGPTRGTMRQNAESTFVGEHDAGLGHQQLDDSVGEDGHELDYVEVGDERVGQLHEHPSEALLINHHSPPFLPATLACALRQYPLAAQLVPAS